MLSAQKAPAGRFSGSKHNIVRPKGLCGMLFQLKIQFDLPKRPLRDAFLAQNPPTILASSVLEIPLIPLSNIRTFDQFRFFCEPANMPFCSFEHSSIRHSNNRLFSNFQTCRFGLYAFLVFRHLSIRYSDNRFFVEHSSMPFRSFEHSSIRHSNKRFLLEHSSMPFRSFEH